MFSREVATPLAMRPFRLRLRGSLNTTPADDVADESPFTTPPVVRAEVDDELLEPFDDPLRETALPVFWLSGVGVRTWAGGGGGGGGELSVEQIGRASCRERV